jgi:hypothetical protein
LKRELSLVVGSKGRGSAGEGGGFVAPDVVEELAVQLFYPSPEPFGGYVENVVCWRIVAASVCAEVESFF